MTRTKALPTNILISSFMITIAAVLLYAAYNNNVQAKNSPVFYDELIVVERTIPAAKEAAITEVNPATTPIQTLPPVLMPPKVIYRILPEFPFSAVEKGIQGTVILSVYVGTSGLPEKIETKTSSGYESLDHSAISGVMQWKFEPAKRGIQSIGSWFEVPVVFRIK
jgi:protein TonB